MDKLDIMIQLSYIKNDDGITGKYSYSFMKTLTRKQLLELLNKETR